MATATEEIRRQGVLGQGSETTRSRVYFVAAASGESDAISTALAQLTSDLGGTTLDGLPIRNINVRESASPGEYIATCTFGGINQQSSTETRVSFEFGQETETQRVAVSQKRYPASAPDRKGLMGVAPDQNGTMVAMGAEVPGQSFTFSKTQVLSIGLVTDGFLGTLAGVFLHTNADNFAGFPPGEVLLVGISGSQRSNVDFEVAYRFSHRYNRNNVVVEGVTVPFVRGWEQLEYEVVTEVFNDKLVPKVTSIYVNQVFHTAPFSGLGL